MAHLLAGVRASFEYSRHLGPRFMHGGVELRFESGDSFSFSSNASWPSPDNYETAIRQGVEGVLMERFGALSAVRVTLEGVSWDPINSCEAGFRCAARAATIACLDEV
jgi:hypothetical protein